MRKSGVAEKYVKVVQDMSEGGVNGEVCGRRCAVGGNRIGSRWRSGYIKDQLFLVCNGDGQVDGQDQAGVSVDYDVHR